MDVLQRITRFPKPRRFLLDKLSVHFQYSNSSTMEKFKEVLVAVCQMTSTNDKLSNFQTVKQLVEKSASAGAKMVFLPEACDYVGTSKPETLQMAQSEDEAVANYAPLAMENGVWLSLGGVHLKTNQLDKISNSHLLLNPSGQLVARYDKLHMFDVYLPENNLRLEESSYVARGKSVISPIPTPAGNLGLAICYDMRFPEQSLTLRNMGADILTFPSAFTFATGAAHWETILKARAIESQCYVIAAAQCGAHNPKRSSWGHALVVGPWGNVIAQCEEGTGFAVANISLNYLESVRKKIPVWEHRRHDLYPTMPGLVEKQQQYTFGQVTVSEQTVFMQTALSIAFTNKRCVLPGHVLVAPIRVVPRFADLTSSEVADLFQLVQKVSTVMEKKTEATSCTVVVQDGPEAGQTIRHVHVHVLPRRAGDFENNDDIYNELQGHDKEGNKFEKPWRTEEEMRLEANEIRQFIQQ